MRSIFALPLCVPFLSVFALLMAQTPAAPETSPAAPEASPTGQDWALGPVRYSGLVDLYYSNNFNHPASRLSGLRNFDVKANQFSLNMAKFTLEHAPEPVGFRVDFGFGRAFDIMHASEPAGSSVLRNIEQAYLSVKPSSWKGVQFDFGQFVTSTGAEVIETHANWNYSRSLLFALALPYYHFGARATVPLGTQFSAGVQLINGWNNVEDNNTGKTAGFTATWSRKWVTWTNNYYVGPEKVSGESGLRHLYDTTLLFTPRSHTSFYLNFDYGTDRNPAGMNSRWVGVAGAARFALSERFALAPRLEWFNDADGWSTGTVQRLKEFTLTGEYSMPAGLITRLEYRRDWSDQPFFERGATPSAFRSQNTILLGLVAHFGLKR